MEDYTRKYRRIRSTRTVSPNEEKLKQPPRRSWTTKAEIDFCVNCPKSKCNGNRCAELKEFLKETRNA